MFFVQPSATLFSENVLPACEKHDLKERGKAISMGKPLLVIVNGRPGTGKTTLSKRLAADLHLPVFSRDGLFETLYDTLDCQNNGSPPLLGHTAYTLLYSITG